jgi:DNA invertase Pin-like site-specific DNA recombinase
MKGDSLRRQTKMSEAFAAEHGLTLRPGYTDFGVSGFRGKNRDRGALRRFLDAVEDHRIARGSWLLVESLDRLSRDRVGEALPEFLSLLKRGIIIATLQDRRIYDHKSVDDPLQLVGSLIVMARAHEESAMKSHRTKEAWKARRENGKKQALCPAWLKLSPNGQSYEPIESRVRTLNEIFEMSANGIGTFSIARILNERGEPPFSTKLEGKPRAGREGRGWHAASVLDLLSHRGVLGELQPYNREGHNKVPDGDPIRGHYPIVIDPALFTRAQAARKKTGKKGRKGTAHSNLLGSLGVCARCGGPMRLTHGARQTRLYLRCGNASSGIADGKCSVGSTYFNATSVEIQILQHVQEYRLSELFSNPETDSELRTAESNIVADSDRIAELEKQQRNVLRQVALLDEEDSILEDYNRMLREQRSEIRLLQDHVKMMKDRRAQLVAQQDQRADVETAILEQRAKLRVLQVEEQMFKKWLLATTDEESRTRFKAELDKVYNQMLPIRAKLSVALQQFIERVEFDQIIGQFDVILIGGKARYRFQRKGHKARVDGVNHNYRASGIEFVGRIGA